MKKNCIRRVLYLIFILIILTNPGCGLRRIEKPESDKVRIILYRKWWPKVIDSHIPFFSELFKESEILFKSADTTYKLVMTEERITEVKGQTVLALIYPEVDISPRWSFDTYFTHLYIPLDTKWYDGTVFFRGRYDHPRGSIVPDYSLISRGLGVVINTRGTGRIKEILRKMGIETEYPEPEPSERGGK
ncbi:hypothetical protein [Desulfonema magnum]|uniref:Uncharacterized protein n=1 Tax=Desulfonema magnum TaxID=45655 RepID=A0A975GKT3_9BACT|nr:hypothetical protein [Desulfonema magnum]QTA84118.1 Uncharacterized protein dnm_001110 [Desulfonema magnum]